MSNLQKYKSHKVVHAEPMNHDEYLDFFADNNEELRMSIVDVAEEHLEGYHVIYQLGTPDEYHAWSPKKIFEDGNSPEVQKCPMVPSKEDLETEEMIQERDLNAPRVSLEGMHDKVEYVDIVQHVTRGGSILRWAVLETETGFAVTGKNSASVSAENDNAAVGEKVAIENAQREMWPLEGYLLKQKLYEATLTDPGEE